MTYKIAEEDFENWTLCFRNNLCSVTTVLNISTSLISIRVVRTIDLWRHKDKKHKYYFNIKVAYCLYFFLFNLFTIFKFYHCSLLLIKFICLICFTFFYYSYHFTKENTDVDNNNRSIIVVAKSLYYILETPIFRNERSTFNHPLYEKIILPKTLTILFFLFLKVSKTT